MLATKLIVQIEELLEEAHGENTQIYITHPDGVVGYEITEVIVDEESTPRTLLIVPGREF